MSVLSFPDVVIFFFIIIKGTFIELKYVLTAILLYFGLDVGRKNDSNQLKDSEDSDEQIYQEKEQLKAIKKIIKLYVSVFQNIKTLNTHFLRTL